MPRLTHCLVAAVLLAGCGMALARGQGAAPAEPHPGRSGPAAQETWSPGSWPADPVEARRRHIERERAALREQIEIERAAARRAIDSDRQAWLERWRRERAQARTERRAREELFRRQQAERFPQLEAYRQRHAEEFERRWHEIEQRRQELVEQLESRP